MEQAVKFFKDFNSGLSEVVTISTEIKEWFSNINISNINESTARNYLLANFNKEYANLSITDDGVWYESKENLALTWRYYTENNEYVFIVNGYYFDDTNELKRKFIEAEGWNVLTYY